MDKFTFLPRGIIKYESIKFVWPFVNLDNSSPDAYAPVFAPQAVAEYEKEVFVRSEYFPWSTDPNTKTPLANNMYLAGQSDVQEIISSSVTNTNSADERYSETYVEGMPEI